MLGVVIDDLVRIDGGSEVCGLCLGFEEVLPEGSVEQFRGKVVFNNVVHLVSGQSVGHKPLEAIAGIP